MKIDCKVNGSGWLRVYDVNPGNVFTIKNDDSNYYMKTQDEWYVSLVDGEIFSCEDKEDICVRILYDARLVIE